MEKFNEEEINKTKSWLKQEGIDFFKKIKEKHGSVNVVYEENGFPHPVHFREGMQVRNFMRMILNYTDDEWLDNNWVNLIKQVIK